MLAFLAGYFILTTPSFRDFIPNLRASLKPLILLGVMALVPTIAVILLYAVMGHWDAWFAANVEAHRVFYGIDRVRLMGCGLPRHVGAGAAMDRRGRGRFVRPLADGRRAGKARRPVPGGSGLSR